MGEGTPAAAPSPAAAREGTDPGITFRVAEPADALCVGVLAAQVFMDTYAVDGIRPSLAREVLELLRADTAGEGLSRPEKRFVLAEGPGHLVGFAEIALGADHPLLPAERSAELCRLYVQERFTGTGLGSALLARAEALAAAGGATALWLTTWVENRRARAFYARRGYRDIGTATYRAQGEEHENRVFARALGGELAVAAPASS
jgi:diamine N-acetyltransferase